MGGEFVTFQRFGEKKSAEQLMALLEKHGVENILEDTSSSLDSTFGTNTFDNNYAVKICQADFERANQALIEDSIADLDNIGKDYYLFSFTDDELREILAHRDEWNAFDYLLAQKLLKQRGVAISQDELEALKQERITALSRPEPRQAVWIVAGYIMAVLGGWLGIIIGWYLSTHKKTLPNGERIHAYGETDRNQGRRILYVGIFFAVFWKLCWFFRWHETFRS